VGLKVVEDQDRIGGDTVVVDEVSGKDQRHEKAPTGRGGGAPATVPDTSYNCQSKQWSRLSYSRHGRCLPRSAVKDL
jgi:hypothetical protein